MVGKFSSVKRGGKEVNQMKSLQRYSGFAIALLLVAGMATGCMNTGWQPLPVSEPAILEDVPGSQLKRLVLRDTAVERLAIETDVVREEKVRRWLMVNGEVEAVKIESAAANGSIEHTASTTMAKASIIPVRVRVPRLDSPEKLAGNAVAVLSLSVGKKDDSDEGDEINDTDDPGDDSDLGEEEVSAVVVLPIGSQYGKLHFQARPIDADSGHSDGTYFEVDNVEPGLRPGQRVIVRIAQPGSGTRQKVVPYSAILYDFQGDTWAYSNPEPRVFIRHAVAVEHVDKDLAILTEGPPLGTRVVTAGATELLSMEQKIGR
jgi:multidrug efflux pump subunit AcrA (membrane-fusion protein)